MLTQVVLEDQGSGNHVHFFLGMEPVFPAWRRASSASQLVRFRSAGRHPARGRQASPGSAGPGRTPRFPSVGLLGHSDHHEIDLALRAQSRDLVDERFF